MSKQRLEQRVVALEQKVAELEKAMTNGAREKDWRRTVGMFTGDEHARRVDEAILAAREKERVKARRSQRKRKKAAASRTRS